MRRYEEFSLREDIDSASECIKFIIRAQDFLKLNPSCQSENSSVKDDHAHVQLHQSISSGFKSSGKSIILDGKYIKDSLSDPVDVKVKLFSTEHASRGEHEYKIMTKLHVSSSDQFVKPYDFLQGKYILPHGPDDLVFCTSSVCIAMEDGGDVDMRKYLIDQLMEDTEKMFVIGGLLNILVAASKAKTVLIAFITAVVKVDSLKLNHTFLTIKNTNDVCRLEIVQDSFSLTGGNQNVEKTPNDKHFLGVLHQ